MHTRACDAQGEGHVGDPLPCCEKRWSFCCVAKANHLTVKVQPRFRDRIRNEHRRNSETEFQVTSEVRTSEIRIWNEIEAN